MDIKQKSILCYVEYSFAYFTDVSLEKQWGDDWNDSPWHCNAGLPYEHTYTNNKRVPHKIYKIAFEGPYDLPDYFSVEQINKGNIAWLRPYEWEVNNARPIHAGDTLALFIEKIEEAGGTVYLPKERVSINPYNLRAYPYPKKDKEYFVSYQYITEYGTGFDNWRVPFPIKDADDLIKVQHIIQKAKGYPAVTILYWREFDK